jgi:hypothetical protein
MKLTRAPLPAASVSRMLNRTAISGALAGAVSGIALAWQGRSEGAGTAAPLNAIGHRDREALWRKDTTASHTLAGAAVHGASSLFRAVFHELIRTQRPHPDARNAVTDALALTAFAAAVDRRAVPPRLKPGLDERLSPHGLAVVYSSFAAGLAPGGVLTSPGQWSARSKP